MKKNLVYLFAMILIPAAFLMSCNEDDGPTPPALDIEISPLAISALPGETIEYTIKVQGDLQSVTLNNDVIKSYEKGTFDDEFTYTYTYPSNATADAELRFSVIDQKNQTLGITALVGYIMPDYTLADFSIKISDEAKWGDWWEGEAINPTPGATYNGGHSSPSMYVTSRGGFADHNWNFAATLPGGGTGLMMTRLSIREDEGGTAWGGYMIPVFGWYGEGMAKPSSQQLDLVKANLRVIAIDAYYETDANSPKSFNELSVAGKGVKFQLRLGNLAKYKASSDKGGWFIAKEAFVAEPNKWITLYFNADDVEELAGLTMDGLSNEIDFAWFIPAMGQDHWDSHKIFLKNFRITNAE
jgi:hypothetical protein